jgi:hypothetical protein
MKTFSSRDEDTRERDSRVNFVTLTGDGAAKLGPLLSLIMARSTDNSAQGLAVAPLRGRNRLA